MDAMNLDIKTIAKDHYLPDRRKRRRTNTVVATNRAIDLYVIPARTRP